MLEKQQRMQDALERMEKALSESQEKGEEQAEKIEQLKLVRVLVEVFILIRLCS